MKLTGNFDPSQKLQWEIGYIAKPGTGPSTKDGPTVCRDCIFLKEELEPMAANGEKQRMRHLFFCGKVVEKVAPIKSIRKETPSCSEFGFKKRY